MAKKRKGGGGGKGLLQSLLMVSINGHDDDAYAGPRARSATRPPESSPPALVQLLAVRGGLLLLRHSRDSFRQCWCFKRRLVA